MDAEPTSQSSARRDDASPSPVADPRAELAAVLDALELQVHEDTLMLGDPIGRPSWRRSCRRLSGTALTASPMRSRGLGRPSPRQMRQALGLLGYGLDPHDLWAATLSPVLPVMPASQPTKRLLE
jgi:hypothetical protein